MRYTLYDLNVIVVGEPNDFNCSHTLGVALHVEGEDLRLAKGVKSFSHYALATLVPYLAAKQRTNNHTDWMYFESEIACPDPQCGARFSIVRTNKRKYEYRPLGN